MKKKDQKLALSLEGVYFKYDFDWVLKDINLELNKNDFLGLVGPNGGGKTTLLKLILGLIKPNIGRVKTSGSISYVPQQLNFDKNFPISAIDVVLLGLLDRLRGTVFQTRDNIEKAKESLASLGIESLASKKFGELSGGQKQRVLIARAVVSKPDILVLDEPTANIDKDAQKMVNHILSELKKEHTLIMVSHNFDYIVADVDKVACINKTLHMHKTMKTDIKNLALIDHSADEEG